MRAEYRMRSIADKFHEKYIPEPNSGCWLWLGSLTKGYGKMGIRVERNVYRTAYAHQVSYMLHKGEIPDGLSVCHTCDTPICVNPDHLWLGTQEDNLQDMKKKDRSGWKLNTAQRDAIRADKRSAPIIAKEYGVAREYVFQLKREQRQ